jgi:adenylosuccinate synthase
MMMNVNKADVLIGLQWGDEGKGKIVDVMAPKYGVVARFQGGPNAGHSLVFEGKKHVLHTVPSGIFQHGCVNVVGNGVVIDPITFCKELRALEESDTSVRSRIVLSTRAHIIMPTHRLLDAASESSKGKSKIGSTLKGIGPAYMDKTGRNGLRIGDLHAPGFEQKYRYLVEKHVELLALFGGVVIDKALEAEWFSCLEELKQIKTTNTEQFLNEALTKGDAILCEGAQGSMLDVDFGTYPFVTSSSTISAGACTGLGLAPSRIGRVIGIFKAYCTRVGSGPFPTELTDDTGEAMRQQGKEFGSTTGRPRRCGWLDLPALKYAIMLNGVTELVMMKADVLNIFDELKVCTHYKTADGVVEHVPYDLNDERIEPVYKTMACWKDYVWTGSDAMPDSLEQYIHFIEQETGVPIRLVSVGPDRKETIFRKFELA